MIDDIVLSNISDSIVLSIPAKYDFGLIVLLNYMVNAVYDSFGGQFALRGAISVGQIYHTRNILFGPSLVEAYKLENEEANYPRIIVTPKTLKILYNLGKVNERFVAEYFRKDSDDLIFFDVLSFANSEHYLLKSVGYGLIFSFMALINNEKKKNNDQRVLNKYLWLFKYTFLWYFKHRALLDTEIQAFLGFTKFISCIEENINYKAKFSLHVLILNDNDELAIYKGNIFSMEEATKDTYFNIKSIIEKTYITDLVVEDSFATFPAVRSYYSEFEKSKILELGEWYCFRTSNNSKFLIEESEIDWINYSNSTSQLPEFVRNYLKEIGQI